MLDETEIEDNPDEEDGESARKKLLRALMLQQAGSPIANGGVGASLLQGGLQGVLGGLALRPKRGAVLGMEGFGGLGDMFG